MSEPGTQYVLTYVREPKTYTINRIDPRPARGVRQHDPSRIASRFPLAPIRSPEERESPARLGRAPESQPKREMTILIFSDHEGSHRFFARPAIFKVFGKIGSLCPHLDLLFVHNLRVLTRVYK